MIKNPILEIIKEREKTYVQHTEKAIDMFLPALKKGLEDAFYNGKQVELYILDVAIIPQNFHFVKVEGQLITVHVGDIIEIDGTEIEIDLENIHDFSKSFSVIIPASMLEEADPKQIQNYLLEVRENGDKIPPSVLDSNRVKAHGNAKEFSKIEKSLDEVQLMALKYFKSSNIH